MRLLPNAITISRIVLTPVLLWLLLQETLWAQFWGTFLFIAAAISDYWDGKLARKFSVRSRLGQFLDPLADKVLVLGTFGVLWYLMPDQVPLWAVLLIALRDAGVTALRSWAEARGRSLRTLKIAKWKTAVQLTYLISTLVFLTASKVSWPPFGPVAEALGWLLASPIWYAALVATALFTVYTGVVYARNMEYTSEVELDR